MNHCFGPLAQLVEQFPLRNGSMVRVHHGSPLIDLADFNWWIIQDYSFIFSFKSLILLSDDG